MNGIQLGLQIDLLAFSSALCIIMYIYLRNNNARNSYSLRLLNYIILATAILCATEIISIVSAAGTTNVHKLLHYWSSAVFLSLTAFPGALWLVYLDYKIIGRKKSPIRRYIFYFIPMVFFIVNNFIINIFVDKGFVFTIDEMNVYSRGKALWIHIIVMYIVLFLAVGNFYRCSNMIRGRISQVVLIVVIVPIIGNIIQMLFYGVTISQPSYVLAAFMTYLILEKDELQRDTLTNLYTRSYIENRLIYKLSLKEPFSLIMLDLNDFKKINDTYGHYEGDQVLKIVAKILVDNIDLGDMVCRYGGDEFIVILEDTRDISEEKIRLFDDKFEEANKLIQDYSIHASYGQYYVDYTEEYSMYELLMKIDKNMYEDKKRRKRAK